MKVENVLLKGSQILFSRADPVFSYFGQHKKRADMEPKSIRTYLDSDETEIYAYDVDVCLKDFSDDISRAWLYYFSLQVNFEDHEEWSHGGFQWSGTPEFRENGNKGVNWGGGSNWAGYGGIGVNNTPFTWECNKWYRYRVWRVEDDSEGFHRWLFAIMDYKDNTERQYGTVRTKSFSIKNAIVFTETGYGVQCDSPRVRLEWRNPCLHSPRGVVAPKRIVANFNGTCANPHNTNQGLLLSSPLTWFHETNTDRIVDPGFNTFERHLQSGINLFTGADFSPITEFSTVGGYTDKRLFS